MDLHRYPFAEMGSLSCAGNKHVGPFARECLTDFSRPDMQALGPFKSLQDYYKASIQLLLHLVHRREIYTDRSVDMYLIYKYLYDKIPEIYSDSTEGPKRFLLEARR
jgi:hypothetical protein